jgi:hypothetical protein
VSTVDLTPEGVAVAIACHSLRLAPKAEMVSRSGRVSEVL